MKFLFVLLIAMLGSCEAFAQVDFTPTQDGIFARVKGGETINLQSDIEAGRVTFYPEQIQNTADCIETGTEIRMCYSQAGSPEQEGWFRPFMTLDGTWYLSFNFAITYSSSTSNVNVELNGIKNSKYSAISVMCADNGVGASPTTGYGFARGGSNILQIYCGSARDTISFGGTIRLSSKPVWLR